jgi:hypothetical protein
LAQDILVTVVDLDLNLVKAGHGGDMAVRGEEGKRGVDVRKVQDKEEAVLDDCFRLELGRELE